MSDTKCASVGQRMMFSWRRTRSRAAQWVRQCLVSLACWYLRWQDDSNYTRHARREFRAAGYEDDGLNDPNKWIQENVLTLLAVLGTQGHSGSSIGFCISYFRKLGLFESLVPLQGTDDEWNHVGDDTWQNNRCSHVFKRADGQAYDIDALIFREPSGACYTNRDSHVNVTFPYVPKREYVDVSESEAR